MEAKHLSAASEQAQGRGPREKTSPLERSITVLETFGGGQDEWGIRALARHLGLSSSSVFRVVSGLHHAGLVQRTVEGRYRLGWRAGSLAVALTDGFRPAELAGEVLEELAAATGETAHLGSLYGREVVYLAKVEGHHAVRLSSRVGQRFPAYATGCGKALLAFDSSATDAVLLDGLLPLTPHTVTDESSLLSELADIRAGALARDNEEIELHAACAAVPVFPPDGGHVRYALSVSGPRERIESTLTLLERSLRAAAAALAGRLHGIEKDRPAAA